MNQPLQTILDFVEGRLALEAFEQILYTDRALERLLGDETQSWHNTTIKTNPYHYLISLNYTDPATAIKVQGALELVLQRLGIACKPDRTAADFYDLLLGAQPKWLHVDTAWLQTHVLPQADGRSGKALKDWLRERLTQLFQYRKKPPKWLQSAEWPVGEHGPLFFLGQIDINEDCGCFHDAASVYLFFDRKTGETRTVTQVA